MIGGKSLTHECSIVETLLPLYHKRILQNDTALFIEQHLASCERCQQPTSARQKRSIQRTLAFFHLLFIVLSFMFAINSSLLGNNLRFLVSYAIFGCLTYLFYKNSWIVFAISFTPVFVWALIDNFNTPLYSTRSTLTDMVTLLIGASFIAILHTIFALLGAAIAIILRKLFK